MYLQSFYMNKNIEATVYAKGFVERGSSKSTKSDYIYNLN